MDDIVSDEGVVHAGLGLGGGQVRVEVDTYSPETPQVVEQRRRVELPEQGLEVSLDTGKKC